MFLVLLKITSAILNILSHVSIPRL